MGIATYIKIFSSDNIAIFNFHFYHFFKYPNFDIFLILLFPCPQLLPALPACCRPKDR